MNVDILKMAEISRLTEEYSKFTYSQKKVMMDDFRKLFEAYNNVHGSNHETTQLLRTTIKLLWCLS